MTKEELLKADVCSRLPYGLVVCNEEGYFTCDAEPSKLNVGNAFGLWLTLTEKAKPILFPPSCLTEEIQFCGEKIVPLEVIGKTINSEGTFKNGSFGWYDPGNFQDYCLEWSEENKAFLISVRGHAIKERILTLKMIDTLNRLMIDYRGLIDKGLAVSVFDLKENPYK